MEKFKVSVERTQCVDVEVEALDYADARMKAVDAAKDEPDDHWCDGGNHGYEIITMDKVMPDDEDVEG